MPGSIDVEILARVKGLPAAALRAFGVRDRHGGGVRIEYVAPEGTPARARLRMALGGLAGSSWEDGELPITAYWRPLASDLARRREPLLLCEGESSCWTAWQWGFGAVGIPGADQVAALRAQHLAYASAVAVVLEPDGPQTYPRGRACYLAEVRERLRAIGYAGRVATLDLDGVAADINTLYQAAPSAFAARLEELIQRALRRNDG